MAQAQAQGQAEAAAPTDDALDLAEAPPRSFLDALAHGGAELVRRVGHRARDFVRGEARQMRRELEENKCLVRCHAHRLGAAIHTRVARTAAVHTRVARTAAAADAAAFPQFARLPAEIRLQIWEAALPGPRVVMLVSPFPSKASRLRAKLGPGPALPTRPPAPVLRSSTPPPALLHVSREARAVALTRYRLGLGAAAEPPRTYVDLDRDVVALSRAELRGPCRRLWRITPDVARVRHLALPYWGYDKDALLPPLWQRCAALEDVALVRSLRWQKGRLPRSAVHDYVAWSEAETRACGLRRFQATWAADGNLVVHDGRKEITLRYSDGLSDVGGLI